MMDERQPTGEMRETRELYGNVAVSSRRTGARMIWSEDHRELRVNTSLFPNEDQARIATLRQVGGYLGLTQAIQTDASILLQAIHEFPEAIEPVLRWQGFSRLRESDPDIMSHHPAGTQNQTLAQEFQWALDTYVLTGKYPTDLSDPVYQTIGRIHKTKSGVSAIDIIRNVRYLIFSGKNYRDFIKPLIDDLADIDRTTGKTNQFEYRPSQTKDIDGDKEPIQEGDIIVSVSPFYGGYYREQVCRYDPTSHQIVKEAGTKQSWDIVEAPEDELVWKTKRTYEGTVQQGQEALIKLPYGALPLPTTLQPANTLQFMRDDLGIVSVDSRSRRTNLSEKFTFDFVFSESNSNQLNIPPTERDFTPVGGDVDPQTQEFLDDLSSQTWMSDVQKGREVTLYVRKKLRYPQDEVEIGQIDSVYLSAGSDLWTTIAETGIAHCYWANIFRDELCKRLGIASRIAIGPYISSKDPRFDFAIVEARGMDKHTWGEIWDSEKGIWTHKGMDATPPKTKDDSEDQDGEQQPMEGDFGESMIDQPELSEEEIQRLYEELAEQSESTTPPTPEEMAARQFEQEKGVPWRNWHQLERWISRVNETSVPAEISINHRPSTIYNQWRELFDLLYKRREVPREQYKGPVRQSEGEILDDPVTAYIDIRSHEDDPMGYQRPYIKAKEQIDVSVFDDDFMLDISGSMSGQPAEEQRKMVLSSEYNIKGLNERFNYSRFKNRMRTPLTVKSRVAAFGDWTTVVKESSDVITEKDLVQLDGVLKAHNQSSLGLHEGLKQYREALNQQTLQKIREGGYAKVLTIVSDGDVIDQAGCIDEIKQLRALGIVVQGIGFGSSAQDIKVVCHDPVDPDAAVVIDDVREATLVRHKLLMKHLSKL